MVTDSFPLLKTCRLAVLLLLVAVLAGCSNDPNPKPLREKRPDGAPWIVSHLFLGEDPRTLDPQVSYDTLGHVIIGPIYETGLQYNLFKNNPFKLEPCLLEEIPRKVQDDPNTPEGGVTYELKVKKGILFHDDPCFPDGKGREVTSRDFLYAFQRIADPAVECPVLATLQEYVYGLGEAFAEAQKAKKFDYSKPFKPITIVDSHTFRLHLSRPYPQILYWLAMPFTAPVPREAVEFYDGKDGRPQFKFHPVGTGPYRLAEWRRSRLLRLARHEGYRATRFPTSGWQPDQEARFAPLAGKPLPFVDEVQFAIIKESIPAWILFTQGYLDRLGVGKDIFNTVMTNSLTLSERFEKRGITLNKSVDLTTGYLQFNMDDPVVGGTNVKLRRALSMAFDFERENEIFRNGIDVKAEQLLPPGLTGYEPELKNPYRVYNLEAAKKLLAEAGYPNGIDPKTGRPLKLSLDVMTGSATGRQMAQFTKEQFTALGIDCELVENTWSRFQDKMHRGNFQMNTGSGWHADYPDPENFFFLFYSKNIPPAGNNYCHFRNAEFDALFEKMATMEDGPEREAIIRRMTAILIEETPVIFGSHSVAYGLAQAWMPRVSDNAMISLGTGLKYMSIDPELRAEKIKEWNRAPLWPTYLLAGLVLASLGYAFIYVRKRNL